MYKTFRRENIASGQVTATAFKTREASANYPKIKKSIKSAKIREYNKALGAADTKAKSVYQKTLTMFTGKSGADPLKHKLVDTKFITTKKFKRGKMDEWSESMMPGKGWHGESFAKLKGAAWHEQKRRSDWFKKPEVIETKHIGNDLIWALKGLEFNSNITPSLPANISGLKKPSFTIRLFKNNQEKVASLKVGKLFGPEQEYLVETGNMQYRVKSKFLDSIPLSLEKFKQK